MAGQGSSKKNKRAGRDTTKRRRNAQKFRTFKNVTRRRAKHAKKYPNDHDSLARARRWVDLPKV